MSPMLPLVVATSDGMSPMVPICMRSASMALTIGGPVRCGSKRTTLPAGRCFFHNSLALMMTPFQPPVQ